MFIRKILRRIATFIRGGPGPLQAFLTCLLGLLIGMIPNFSALTLILILLLIILNVNIGVALMCTALGRLLAFVLAPATFEVGFAVIHSIGLEGLFRAASDTPVVALLDLHYYCVTGGLVVGLVVGSLLGIVVVKSLMALRRKIAASAAEGGRLDRIGRNKFARFFMWLLIGGSKKTVAKTLAQRQSLIRKAGVLVCLIIVGLGFLLEWFLSGSFLAQQLAGGLTGLNRAQVDVANVSLSLVGGRAEVGGLEFTDRSKPTHNAFQTVGVKAELSIPDLLAKRVVVNKLEVSLLETDQLRKSPGRVIDDPPKPVETTEIDVDKYGRVFTEYLGDPEKVRKCLDQLEKVQKILADIQARQRAAGNKNEIREQARRSSYWDMAATNVLSKKPAIIIRELVIGRIRLPGQPHEYVLKAKNLTSDPQLMDDAMSITFGDIGADGQIGKTQRLSVSIDFRPQASHQIDAMVADLAIPCLSEKVPLDVSDGRAKIAARGTFSAEQIDLPLMIQVSGMKAGCRSGRTVLGLPPDHSQRIFDGLSNFTLIAALRGPLDRPRLVIDDKQTLSALKESLVGTAKAELARQVDQQLKKAIGGNVDLGQIQNLIPTGGSGNTGGLGDLLNPPRRSPTSQPERTLPAIPDFLRRN